MLIVVIFLMLGAVLMGTLALSSLPEAIRDYKDSSSCFYHNITFLLGGIFVGWVGVALYGIAIGLIISLLGGF